MNGLRAAVAIALAGFAAAVLGSPDGARSFSAHSDPCHRAHACPSDHHSYPWKGLSCTSYADERVAADTKKVTVEGRVYWCHPDSSGQASTGATSGAKTGSAKPAGAALVTIPTGTARKLLARLPTRPAGSMDGYSREQFGSAWRDVDANGCDTRNDILRRDLRKISYRGNSSCVISRGTLNDPYTATTIQFTRGVGTSTAVQIDHVVALADAWRTGAAIWTSKRRLTYANDPVVLLAVDGPANEQKSDGDASEWLPSNRAYDCIYVKRQITIKTKYQLWVTLPERAAMRRVLKSC